MSPIICSELNVKENLATSEPFSWFDLNYPKKFIKDFKSFDLKIALGKQSLDDESCRIKENLNQIFCFSCRLQYRMCGRLKEKVSFIIVNHLQDNLHPE